MGITIGTREQVDAYFNSTAINQSELKELGKGFAQYVKKKEKGQEGKEAKSTSYAIGSAVDCILTGADGEFSDRFHVSSLQNTPSDLEIAILDLTLKKALAETDSVGTLEEYGESFLLESADQMNWQMRWKDETRLKKLLEAGSEYFEDMKNGAGKTMLSEAEYLTVTAVVESLKSHPSTWMFFDRDYLMRDGSSEVFYQYPIFFKYKGVECKALLDLVIMTRNEEGEAVRITPFDLKTMQGHTIDFPHSLKRFRYDIQGAWYTLALKESFPTIPVAPFRFIVESTTDMGTPLVFEMDPELLYIGENGRKRLDVNDVSSEPMYDEIMLAPEIKGYSQLMDEYIHYRRTEWKQDKRITDALNGVLKLNWNGIMR